MTDNQGRRRSVADVLTAEVPGPDESVIALDASVAKGRAYLALRGADGQVRPVYLLLDPIDEADPAYPVLVYKYYPVDESPRRWPMKVAQALTTWVP